MRSSHDESFSDRKKSAGNSAGEAKGLVTLKRGAPTIGFQKVSSSEVPSYKGRTTLLKKEV